LHKKFVSVVDDNEDDDNDEHADDDVLMNDDDNVKIRIKVLYKYVKVYILMETQNCFDLIKFANARIKYTDFDCKFYTSNE
jgi:hypothetical protein